MKRFRLIIAFVLLALWLPAVLYCRLEKLPGFDELVSCPHSDSSPSQDRDCSDQMCPSIESGDYRTTEEHLFPTVPDAVVPDFIAGSPFVTPPASVPDLESLSLSPPELLSGWCFARHVAASPRAPSPVS